MSSPARTYLASLAPNGRKAAAYQLRKAARILTGRAEIDAVDWHRLTRPRVIAILDTLREEGMAITTITHHLSILRRVSEEAWQNGQMPVEVYQRIIKIRSPHGSRLPAGRAPSREAVRAAIERARDGPTLRHLRDAALLATLVGAGLRCFEVVSLTRDAVEGDRLRLLGKGNREALQPLAPAAQALLAEYLEALPATTTPLFPRWRRYDCATTTPLSVSGVRRVILEWLPGHSPHDLRRAYATWLAADGHGLPVIQRLMRHADPATTMRYIRNEEDIITASANLQF